MTVAERIERELAELRGAQPAVTRPVWDVVVEDMRARDAEGMRRYGKPLLAGDGRDGLWDAYEEALDLVVYLRKVIIERDAKKSEPAS